MVEKSTANRSGLSPAWYGTASLVAACLAWASVWLAFNQGPDGITKNRIFTTVATVLLPMFCLVCGLLGVGAGIQHRSWVGITTGVIGSAMIAYEAWLLSMNR